MLVNELECPWQPGLTLAALRSRVKPRADVAILNGFPVRADRWAETYLQEGDAVALIERGEKLEAGEVRRLLHARHTPGVAKRLARGRVGIAGAGGLGSHVAMALARTGVGQLAIADYDVVEPSNLNRQLYATAQLGMSKVQALAENLAGACPAAEVQTHACELTADNIPRIFAGCAVVAECLDRPESKPLVVEAVLANMPGAWVVAASGLAGLGDANAIRTRLVRERFVLVGDGESAALAGRGLMAPRVMVAAGHQALAIVRILLGEMSA